MSLSLFVGARRPSVHCRGIQRAEEDASVALPIHGLHGVQLTSASVAVPHREQLSSTSLRHNKRKSVSLPNLAPTPKSKNIKISDALQLPNIFPQTDKSPIVIPSMGPFFAKI